MLGGRTRLILGACIRARNLHQRAPPSTRLLLACWSGYTARMRYRGTPVLVFLAVVLACAHVRQQYAAYEGPDAVRKGEGGTKFTVDGVDFWTTGSPPRQYRILGILTDTRRDKRIAAASFAPDIAERVAEVGGNAVIYIDESTKYVGTYSTGHATATSYGNTASANAYGYGVAISDKSTQLLVIRYED